MNRKPALRRLCLWTSRSATGSTPTPARQIGWKFVGTFVAATFTGVSRCILAYLVNRKKAGDTDAIAKARENRGVLIASGLMAGGAIMGVVAALVKMRWPDGFPILSEASATGAVGEWIAIAALAALCTYVVVSSRKGEA